MNIHEYQGKEIFRKHGVPVPMGVPAFSVDEAEAAAKKIIAETGSETVVVKAQIHAGGRGKGGGVKVVKGVGAARDAASKLLGMTLVTKQTGPAGKTVQRLLVEQGLAIDHEYYLALVVDRETRRIAVMTSYEGGMDIEEVAAKTPEKILRETIDPATGFMPYHGRKLAYGLGLRGAPAAAYGKLVGSLYAAFVAEDCSLVEVNPLVTTKDGHVIALDSKINFDDNGEFRHPEWDALHDRNEDHPAEARAKEVGLNYVDLDGNIGCLVNGAGLAMATMDVIKYAGGEPANFLDVGGGATKEQVTNAFKIILTSPEVKGIFVNIFGGIMRCDVIAEGVVAATKELGLKIPAVVRLEGTNVEMGRKILSDSGLALTTAGTMLEGAQKIVALVKGK